MIDMMKYDDKEITGQVNMMWDKERKTKENNKRRREKGKHGCAYRGPAVCLTLVWIISLIM